MGEASGGGFSSTLPLGLGRPESRANHPGRRCSRTVPTSAGGSAIGLRIVASARRVTTTQERPSATAVLSDREERALT